MSLQELISFYRRVFVECFFHQGLLSPAFQALLDTSENQTKLLLWQQKLARVAELMARELISNLAQSKEQFLEVIALAQIDAAYLSNKIALQQNELITHVPAIESLSKYLQDKHQVQERLAKISDIKIYSASREDIKAYIASIANQNITQNFYQFIKATHPSVEVITCSADLSELDLSGKQFQSCDFSGAKIRLARNADFRHCQLIGADLQQADLTGCDFQGANLSFANVQSAQLKEVNLTAVNLTGANFSKAYLDISRSEQAQWMGADLTDINTESLIIAEQLQQKQQEQMQQYAHRYKREHQVWQTLWPDVNSLLVNISESKWPKTIAAEHQQILEQLTQQLQQTILALGLLRYHFKALQTANRTLKVVLLDESLTAMKQQLKALRHDPIWQHLLTAWQACTQALIAEHASEGIKELTTLITQTREQLQTTRQKLQSLQIALRSIQDSLQVAALTQWQATRVRMAFDHALTHIEQVVSKPYRQTHLNNNHEEKSLSCFISYSWGDPINEYKVHRIAADLRQAGIGMLLDIWDNKPGTSVSRFTHETRNCDIVLLAGTLKLMEKWRIKMGVVSQEIPQIYGRLDQIPLKRVIGLQLNGETLDEVLPQEFLTRKKILEQNDFVDLRQTHDYERGIFQILRQLYNVQSNTPAAQTLEQAEQTFRLTAQAIQREPLQTHIQALGYELSNASASLQLSMQAMQRYAAEKQAQKSALENLLPTTLNKLYQAYEARQKQQPNQTAIGIVSGQLALAQPLPHTISEVLQQSDISPVLLIKTQQETTSSIHLLEKTLWRHYQYDPERQPIPMVVDFKKVLGDVNGPLPDNYDVIMHVLRQQLHYNEDEIQRLKSDYRLVFIFTPYEALGALSYAPYIDNHLEHWPQAKAIVLCDLHFLANKNYQTVFSAGKHMAHLKLWEGEAIVWTVEQEQTWQAHLKSQPIARSARELPSNQTEVLRDFVVQEQFVKTLKMIQKHLGNKAPSLYVSYAPGEPELTWHLIERLMMDLPQAGFKVLMDVRHPASAQEDDSNAAIQIPSSRYLPEMEQSDFILVTGSRWYLQQYEHKTKALQEELDLVVQIEEKSKSKSQGTKNFTSPIMPLLLERPVDSKARLETILPPIAALRDSVCIDFKRPDQSYFDVFFDQLIPALYQASVYLDRQSIIQEAHQQFFQSYKEVQKLDAEGLMQKVGYKQPTLAQAEQYLARQMLLQNQNSTQLAHLVPARLQPLFQAHQQRVQQPELSQALAYYVPLDGELQPTSEERFELATYLAAFLDPKNASQVLLLQGESGSGKSLSIHRLEQQLWQAYRKNPQVSPIPILIELKAIETDVPTNFIEHYLQQRLGYSENAISILKEKHAVVFLLDGYDELPGKPRAVFIDNHLEDWQQAKVIVTARPSVIQQITDYRDYFKTTQQMTVQECYVSPFSQKQINTYLIQFSQDIKKQRLGWDLARYQVTLASMPSIQDIMASPLLLRMVVEVLPELTEQQSNIIYDQNSKQINSKPIMRADVYRLFIRRWFTREDVRLFELGNRPIDFDAQTSFGEFAEKLAFHMFLHGLVEVHYEEAQDANNTSPEWAEYFNSDDPTVVQKRSGCPLKQVEKRYSFYHKSFLEYFAAVYIYKTSYLGASADNFQAMLPTMPQWPINMKSMTQDSTGTGQAILAFLKEMIGNQALLRSYLLTMIKASAYQEVKAIAAANAITVLNYAGMSFRGLDLSGVCIPSADLGEANLDSVNLIAANLREVNLTRAWLRHTNLQAANLTKVRLGERPFTYYNSRVNALAWHPQGRYRALAIGKDVILEDLLTEKQYVMKGHKGTVWSLAWSSTGKLASGSQDKTVIVWNLTKFKAQQTLQGHTERVNSVAWSNADELASASYDATIIIWDLSKAKPGLILEGHTDKVTCVAWSNTNKLASGSMDTTVIIWDLVQAKAELTLCGHKDSVNSIAWNMNGELASGSADTTVIIWDVMRSTARQVLQGHTDWVNSVAWSAAGELASGGRDTTIIIWNIVQNSVRHTLGHKEWVNGVTWNASGELASCSDDKTVILWDVAHTITQRSSKGHIKAVTCLAWNSDWKLASGSADNTVIIWDITQGTIQQVLHGHKESVTSVAWSLENELASGSHDKSVIVWDTMSSAAKQVLYGHTDKVTSVAWSASSELASGSADTTVIIWNIEQGTVRQIFKGHKEWVTSVAWSLAGDLASGSRDMTVIVWDVAQAAVRLTLTDHKRSVTSVAWSLAGDLASGSADKTVIVWDLIQSNARQIFQGHKDYVSNVAWHATGGLASCSFDKSVIIWDIQTGKPKTQLVGYFGEVNSLVWVKHQDCTYLATGSNTEQAVKVWQCIQDTPDIWQLKWSSHPPMRLFAEGCQLDQAIGLTTEQIRLLKEQKGAVGEPQAIGLTADNTIKNTNLNTAKISRSPHSFVANIGASTNTDKLVKQQDKPEPQATSVALLKKEFG